MTVLPVPPQRVHLVGIGGAGMSGIARILLQRGHGVTGSDLREGRSLEELRVLGATIEVGHAAEQVGDVDAVVISTAVGPDNPEVVEAASRGIPVLRRAEMLASLLAGERGVLIAGTHGKTTTTSMTVVALQAAGLDPSFAIGGALNETGTNAHAGTDPIFVAEADESDRSFLVYRPDVAVVTNVEHDHPEEFEDLADVESAFRGFLGRRAPGGPVVLCADDPGALALADVVDAPVLLYGTSPRADVRMLIDGDIHRLRIGTDEVASVELAVPGRHNILNATAALAVCHVLDADVEAAAKGLARFSGVARRFQVIGEVGGVTVVDDYAHHPTELRATLNGARTVDHERIVVVVQPHRYSRTANLGAELGRAAAAADLVVITDVYGAGEAPVPGVTGRLVADAAEAAGATVRYAPHLTEVVELLLEAVRPGDLVLTAGAGDVSQVGTMLLSRLGGQR